MTCSRCGADNPEGFRFCGNCGAPLVAEPAPAREERKIVTVLFADLVGFTSQVESLDPEDVRELLGGYHRRLRADLERYGGTVEKFIGDAVMALFGAPAAHEDDPERAVRAAFAIRDTIAEHNEAEGRSLHVRIGITTGEALVNLGARPDAGEGMASGDVVNTAARLQSAAPVDGVLVDERTFRATERAIVLREVEPVTAKGKAEPVRVWEAVEPRARLGVDVTRRAHTPLVGRFDEVELLRSALARSRRERSLQLVTVIGVPGIGKSRLVHELLQIVEADQELIAWRQGRSLPYGEGVSFRALGDMVKAQAGILENDPDEDAARKLGATVANVLSEADEQRWVEQHLRPLVGLAREGEAGRDEAFAAWRRFLEALAERGPAILVFEDLHWADDGLLDFVEHLADWATGVPLLVVCTARPELLGRRSGWGGGKPNAATLSLAPLSDDETARLLGLLLERNVMPAEEQRRLLAHAGGNPLYAEEFVRMTEEGGGGGRLPETVQGIIAARLDGLDPTDKELLQDAAVLGKVFWRDGVAAVGGREPGDVERRLHELERRQIVRRERRSSVARDVEYGFWHLLVRDVAYGQIPRAARAEKHRRAAEWTASISADRLADRADLLAHHYLAAVDLMRAAGRSVAELEEPARLALRAAGDRALALSSYRPAMRFFREALELWPSDDPERPRLLLSLARAIFSAEDAGDDVIAQARDALVEVGDLEGVAEAETLLGEYEWMRGRPQQTAAHLRRAVELVEGRPLTHAKAYVAWNVSRYAMLGGDHTLALETGREALALAEQLDLDRLRAASLNNIGTSRVNLGDIGGLDDLERAIEIAAAVGSEEGIRCHINLGSVLFGLGEVRRSREVHRSGLALARRFGQVRGLRFLAAELAIDAYFAGEWDEAEDLLAQFLGEVEAGSPHYMETAAQIVRGTILFARGHRDDGLSALARASTLGREADEPQTVLPALAAEASAFAELGSPAHAQRALDLLLAEISRGEPRFELWLYPAIVAFDALDRLDELKSLLPTEPGSIVRWIDAARRHAADDLAGAAGLLRDMGSVPDEAWTRLRLAEQLAAAGRRAEADAELTRAVAFYRSVGASFYIARAQRVLAASA